MYVIVTLILIFLCFIFVLGMKKNLKSEQPFFESHLNRFFRLNYNCVMEDALEYLDKVLQIFCEMASYHLFLKGET